MPTVVRERDDTQRPEERAPRPPQGRGVPVLFGGLTVGLVVVIASVSLVVQQLPPPSVAEFAPNPQTIDEVRQEQAAPAPEAVCVGADCAPQTVLEPEVAEGEGPIQGRSDVTAGSSEPPVEPTGPQIAARGCFGDPALQYPHHFAPLCVADIFTGDNGGATSRGVTATDIRVAICAGDEDAWRVIFEEVNTNFELWGRRLTPLFHDCQGDSETEANATAESVAATVQPFAALKSSSPQLMEPLARRGVVAIAGDGVSEASMEGLDPFLWSLAPGTDLAQKVGAELVCGSLAGGPARHAGDNLAGETRRFGILVAEVGAPPISPDTGVLSQRVEACTGTEPVHASHNPFQDEHGGDTAGQAMLRFKTQGVTTVVCVGGCAQVNAAARAEALDYRPEWFHIGAVHTARAEQALDDLPPEQARRTFGVTDSPVVLPAGRTAEVEIAARRELDHTAVDNHQMVQQLMLLGSGIQAAGPELTPEAFAAGLRSTVWPNPRAGRAPYFQPAVGFTDDHAFYDDHLVWWVNLDVDPADDDDPDAVNGGYCYTHGATRFRPGQLPTDVDHQLFRKDVPCRP